MTQKNYPIHPAAELFPLMTDEEFAGLKEDIRRNGQCEKILILKGSLIDGRHRLRACRELGIEPDVCEMAVDIDPVAWVLSHNLHRRHLTTAQRAMVAEKLATLRLGDNQHGKEGAVITSPSQDDAAKALGVSRDSVRKARKVRAKATSKVITAVESGTMSLNAAVKTTNPDRPKKKNGTEKLSAAKLVDALTKQHIGHIARGLTRIAKANRGEGVQFKAADAGLNQMIIALQKMREGET